MSSFKNKIFLILLIVLMNKKSCNSNFTLENNNQPGIISSEETLLIELSIKSVVEKINQHYFHGRVVDYENNNSQKSYEEFNKFDEEFERRSNSTANELTLRLDNDKTIQLFYDDLNYLQNSYNIFFPTVNNESLPFDIRKKYIYDIVKENSDYRLKLSEFVNKFFIEKPGPTRTRVFDAIINNYKFKVSKNLDCDNAESLQMIIHSVYTKAVFVLIRNYALIKSVYHRSSHRYLLKSQKTKAEYWHKKLFEVRANILNDIGKITEKAGLKLVNAARKIRTCDPVKHERGKTYERLTNFIQAWVGSQEYLNKDNKCKTCSYEKTEFYEMDYWFEKTDRIHPNLFPHGTLYNCTEFSDFNVLYQSEPINPERIYHHLACTSTFGRRNEAPEKSWGNYLVEDENIYLTKYTLNNIRHTHVPFFYPCDICLCYVDQTQEQNSTRRISLTPVIASAGAVVTGIQWVIRNKIIALEIQEGQYKNGSIDSNNLSWHGSPVIIQTKLLNANLRSFWLEDFTVPTNSLVAGVRFIVEDGRIHLSLLGVEVDENEEFIAKRMEWYRPAYHEGGEELVIEKPDRSELAPTDIQHVVLNKPGKQFVKFQPTDLEKDAGQTTIPYLDIQRVVTNPPAPINGVGFYYKGSKGFGGFLGLQLISRNYSRIKFEEDALNTTFHKIDELIESHNNLLL